jgi:hypothetical protein
VEISDDSTGRLRKRMRGACVVLFLTSVCLPLLAKDRNWQDSVFLGVGSVNTGAAAMPIGTAVVAVPLTAQHYWLRANDLVYCLYFPSRLSGRVPNLTVNGHTKFAAEGRNVYILDDDGKQWKLHIVEKIAPKEKPSP